MGVQDFLEGNNERMNQQLLFTAEIDKMTDVLRQTVLINKADVRMMPNTHGILQ